MIRLQLSFILILLSYTVAQSNMEKGLEWYEKRAEGAKGFKAKSIPIDRSIEFFQKFALLQLRVNGGKTEHLPT